MNALATLLSTVLAVAATGWNPASFANQGTVDFLTVAPDEGEHWSTVWFVVIDDAVYLRLGPRAARRIEKNSTAPRLQLRVTPEQVHSVRYKQAPEMAERIAVAMYEKYWTDFLGEPFRKLGLSATPMMLRLVPDDAAAPG